jgi:hypothetical protein
MLDEFSRHPQSQNDCVHRLLILLGRLRASQTKMDYRGWGLGCQEWWGRRILMIFLLVAGRPGGGPFEAGAVAGGRS